MEDDAKQALMHVDCEGLFIAASSFNYDLYLLWVKKNLIIQIRAEGVFLLSHISQNLVDCSKVQ